MTATNTPRRLFLLDAYALIYRAYYAFISNPRIDSKGRNTSAIFGFVLTLQEILEKENPDAIAVAFDLPRGTFRDQLFPEYKAQREATPEGITLAIPYIRSILKAYQIPTLSLEGYEADDVIGTLAKQAAKKQWQVYMVTSDKDYAQLVSDKIFMYRPASRSGGYDIWGIEEVKKKYGLQSPEQMVDYLGLVGDSSDNVPGCPGIGVKSAQGLLSQFANIEEIYQRIDDVKPAWRKKLEAGKEQTLLSKKLVTIVQDAPIEFDAQSLLRNSIDEEAVADLFSDLEFKTLLTRVVNRDPATSQVQPIGGLFASAGSLASAAGASTLFAASSSLANYQTTQARYHTISEDKEIVRLAQLLAKSSVLAFDTETDGLDALTAGIVGISFSVLPQEGYYIPLPPDPQEAAALLAPFAPLFDNPRILKVAHNAKFDIEVLLRYGIPYPTSLFDTILAHYLLFPDRPHGLDILAESLLQYQTIRYQELSPKKEINLREDVDPDLLAQYAAEDADIALQLYNLFEPQLRQEQLWELFTQIEMPLVKVLVAMEQSGVSLDLEALQFVRTQLLQGIEQSEKRIYDYAGTPFNVNSPKQVGEVLFDILKLVDKPKKTKTGAYQTGEEILVKIKNLHPIVEEILLYRESSKLLNTYIDALPRLVYPDGKLHTSYNQAVASTGRLSSSNPNLQNIPIRTEYGRLIRTAFVADDKGFSPVVSNEQNIVEQPLLFEAPSPSKQAVLLSADYSQIELRIIAHLSQDPALIEAFKSGRDIHTATAAKIFAVTPDEVTPLMRSKAKTANFGLNYGITAFGLSERLNIPISEANELKETYFTQFSKVKEYMEQVIEQAREQGYVSTVFGRKRHLRNINSKNGTVRSFDERNAINAPIQGTAADLIKIAMIAIQQEFENRQLQSEMILQVHDELVFNVYTDELEQVKTIVKKEMEGVWPQCVVPLTVEIGVGDNWLQAH